MTQDDIIEMAREAGFLTNEIKSWIISPYNFEDQDLYEELEVFAKLVAAKTLEGTYDEMIALVREDEREACAKICDDLEIEMCERTAAWYSPEKCASAIRARGEA